METELFWSLWAWELLAELQELDHVYLAHSGYSVAEMEGSRDGSREATEGGAL